MLFPGSPLGLKRSINALPNIDISATSVWSLMKPTTKEDYGALITSLLDSIGGTLEKRARLKSIPQAHGGNTSTLVELTGSEAFAQPIGWPSCSVECMLIDPFLVARGTNREQPRRQKHISMGATDDGYATVWLAKRPIKSGRWIKIRAHQLVCWSSWGPPKSDIIDPVVMHYCDSRSCLNPDHLVWGERKQNMRGGNIARDHAEFQMISTRRQIPS